MIFVSEPVNRYLLVWVIKGTWTVKVVLLLTLPCPDDITPMVPVGESRIELLEPTSPDSAIAKFLDKRGEGLHHVALQVDDLSATVERLKASGTRLISDEIKVGAGGHLYVFVHPSSAGGVLLELVEDAPQGV